MSFTRKKKSTKGAVQNVTVTRTPTGWLLNVHASNPEERHLPVDKGIVVKKMEKAERKAAERTQAL
jgi:hypothetical protein